MGNQFKLAFSDRLAIGGVVVGAAGSTATTALPFSYSTVLSPETWRIIFWVSATIFIVGIMYLLWDIGRYYKTWRCIFYASLFSLLMGVLMHISLDKSLFVRGLLGAISGALILILSPSLYSKAQSLNKQQNENTDSSTKQNNGGTHIKLCDLIIADSERDNIYVAPNANATIETCGNTKIYGAG